MADTPSAPTTGALAINKSGPVRYMEDSALQASIANALKGITADHGAVINIQVKPGFYAGIAVLKVNKTWSVSQAFSHDGSGWGSQTGVMAQW